MDNLHLPYFKEKIENAQSKLNNLRFSHCTKLTNAVSIIKSNELWMSRADSFSDKTEIEYGRDIFNEIIMGGVGDRFNIEVPYLGIEGGLFRDYYKDYTSGNTEEKYMYEHSFIFCLREELAGEDNCDDSYMWEHYVKSSSEVGVTFIFKAESLCRMFEYKPNLEAMFILAPVLYKNEHEIKEYLENQCKKYLDQLKKSRQCMNDTTILIQTFFALFSAIILTKHKCNVDTHEDYTQEKEWRIIFATIPDSNKSPIRMEPNYGKRNYGSGKGETRLEYMEREGKSPVYKIKIGSWEKDGASHWDKIIDKVYIGPGEEIKRIEAFNTIKELLHKNGVKDIEQRVCMSKVR